MSNCKKYVLLVTFFLTYFINSALCGNDDWELRAGNKNTLILKGNGAFEIEIDLNKVLPFSTLEASISSSMGYKTFLSIPDTVSTSGDRDAKMISGQMVNFDGQEKSFFEAFNCFLITTEGGSFLVVTERPKAWSKSLKHIVF